MVGSRARIAFRWIVFSIIAVALYFSLRAVELPKLPMVVSGVSLPEQNLVISLLRKHPDLTLVEKLSDFGDVVAWKERVVGIKMEKTLYQSGREKPKEAILVKLQTSNWRGAIFRKAFIIKFDTDSKPRLVDIAFP